MSQLIPRSYSMFSDFPIPRGTGEPNTAIKSFVRSLWVCVSSIKKPNNSNKTKTQKTQTDSPMVYLGRKQIFREGKHPLFIPQSMLKGELCREPGPAVLSKCRQNLSCGNKKINHSQHINLSCKCLQFLGLVAFNFSDYRSSYDFLPLKIQAPYSEFKLAIKKLAFLNYLSEQRACRPQVKGHFAEENSELGSSKPSARDQASEPGALPWITVPGSILYFGALLWDRPKNKQFSVEGAVHRQRGKKKSF